MRTLSNAHHRAAIEARLAKLRPDTARRWGRMSAGQMVCHVTDALRGVMGERASQSRRTSPTVLQRTALKWIALYAPLPWPHGLRTRPEADQERGGTPPTDFDHDVASLHDTTDRFLGRLAAVAQRPHFLFGSLSETEWARWAYRHLDHHLRQFGL